MIVIREGQEPVEVRTGDEPFQVFILAACALWGVVSLATLSSVTTATARTIPLWGAYVFFAGLATGTIAALLGIACQWRKKVVGFYVERAGLLMLVGLCGAYSIWALAASGVRAFSLVFLLVAIGAASAVRIRRITRGMRAVKPGGAP